MKAKKAKTRNTKYTKRQNFKLAKMDRKVQMGKHSGKTARAISRHQMASVVSSNLNTMNVNTNHKLDANIKYDKGSLAATDVKDKEDKPTNNSTDILGWLN